MEADSKILTDYSGAKVAAPRTHDRWKQRVGWDFLTPPMKNSMEHFKGGLKRVDVCDVIRRFGTSTCKPNQMICKPRALEIACTPPPINQANQAKPSQTNLSSSPHPGNPPLLSPLPKPAAKTRGPSSLGAAAGAAGAPGRGHLRGDAAGHRQALGAQRVEQLPRGPKDGRGGLWGGLEGGGGGGALLLFVCLFFLGLEVLGLRLEVLGLQLDVVHALRETAIWVLLPSL